MSDIRWWKIPYHTLWLLSSHMLLFYYHHSLRQGETRQTNKHPIKTQTGWESMMVSFNDQLDPI